MTIATTTNRFSYSGNGSTTAFAYSSKFLANGDLVVLEVNNTTGVVTTKTITTHYTVTGAGDANGGTVTMLTAPASGTTLVIYGDPARTQGVDLVSGEDLAPDAGIETPLDRLTLLTQRLSSRMDRAVRLPDGDISGASTLLPIPAASKFLRWNSAATALENATAADFPSAVIVSAESIGAVGDGVTDCTSAFNTALALGYRIWLKHGLTYKVTSRLVFANNAGLLSDGTGKIYAPAASFANTTIGDRYEADSSVISLLGGLSGAFTPLTNVIVDGIIVESEVSGARMVDAIVARNVTNMRITNNEIFGFPVGCGVRASTIAGNSHISRNYIHTFTTNTNWSGDPATTFQISGVELDGDRVNSVNSDGVEICDNRIYNLTAGATALAAHGYQTDGINVQTEGGTNHTICRNRIKNVGEGIDVFAKYCTVVGNTIDNPYIFGIKLIHGAQYNVVAGNTIRKAGLAGINLSGSNSATGNTANNLIVGNNISNIDPDSVWGAVNTACIRTSDPGSTRVVSNNHIADNILDPGSAGDYAISIGGDGTNNTYIDNRILATGLLGRVGVPGTETYYMQEANKTCVRIGRGTTQSITNSVTTKIEFATEQVDRRAEYDNATNYRWTCQIPGPYEAKATVRFGTMADTSLVTMYIYKNGAAYAVEQSRAGGANDHGASIADTVPCVAGDYLEFFVRQEDSAARDISGDVTLCYASINPA